MYMISPLMAAGTRRMLSRPSALYRRTSLLGFPTANFATSSAFKCPNSSNFVSVDAVVDSAYPNQKSMRINLAHQVEITFKQDTTLAHFHDELTAHTQNKVNDIKFYTITGSRIPLSEAVGDLREYPILLQVNGDKVFALNFTNEFKVTRETSNNIKEEEHYYDFAKGVGLNDYEKFFFSNFAHHMQHALPQHKSLLSAQEVANSLAMCLRYYGNKSETAKIPIEKITKQLQTLQAEYGPNQQKISEFRVSAGR